MNDKSYYAQKFNVPERDITPEFIPLFKSFEIYGKEIHKVSEKLQGKIETVNYSDPKTAFWGNFGKIGLIAISIAFSVTLIWCGWIYKEINSVKYQNLERLSKFVEVKNDAYFIHKNNYQITKDGITLK